MLLEKLTGFDVGLWDRSILTEESKSLFKRGTLLNSYASLTKCFFFFSFQFLTITLWFIIFNKQNLTTNHNYNKLILKHTHIHKKKQLYN